MTRASKLLAAAALGAVPLAFASDRVSPEAASIESTPANDALYHNDSTPGVLFLGGPALKTAIHGDFIHLQDYGSGLLIRRVNLSHGTAQSIPGHCSDSSAACVGPCNGQSRRCTRTGEPCAGDADCPQGNPSNGQFCDSCLFDQDWVDRLSIYDAYSAASSPVYSGVLVRKIVNVGGAWPASTNLGWFYDFPAGELEPTDPDLFYTVESKLVDYGASFDDAPYLPRASWNFRGGGPPERGASDTGSYIDGDGNGILDAADAVPGYFVSGCPAAGCQANLRMFIFGLPAPGPSADFYTIAGNGDSYVDLDLPPGTFDNDDTGFEDCTDGLGASDPLAKHVVLQGREIVNNVTGIAAVNAIFERSTGFALPGTAAFTVRAFSAGAREGDALFVTRDGVPEEWSLTVCRGGLTSSGAQSASRNECPELGGSMTLTLQLRPRLTFVKRGNPACVVTIDTGVPVPMASEPFRWNDTPSAATVTLDGGIGFDTSCNGSVDTPAVSGSSYLPWFPGTFAPRCDASCAAAGAPVTRVFRLTGPGWGIALHQAVATDDLAVPTDTDGDGVLDGADDCDLVADPAQLDSDGDGVGDACDNAPLCNPDQADADSDGIGDVSDCAPADPANTTPGQTADLRYTSPSPDKSTITWSATPAATSYDAVRGLLSGLPVGPGGGDEVCFGNLATASLTDSSTPATGAGFFYVVRAENACGNGGYGSQGQNGVPGPARVTTTCP